MWFCGGHGLCTGDNGPDGRLEDARLRWMDRWLKRDRSVDTGPVFEWLTDTDGKWHSAEAFPLPAGDPLRAGGSGSLPIAPTDYPTGGGQAIAASPATGAFEIDLPAAEATVDVIGEPKLELTYSGTAVPARTHLFAQLVDLRVNRVVGNQVAPVPVNLDGREHRIEVPLEPIAAQLESGARLRLQIAGGTTVYYPQRSSGSVELRRVHLTVPTVRSDAAPRLAVSKPRRLRSARPGRPARAAVRAHVDGFRDVRAVLLKRKRGPRWKRVGRSRRFQAGLKRKRVRIRVRRRLRSGTYLLRVRATDMYGAPVLVERRARLRRR
jgi:hypothetical protein